MDIDADIKASCIEATKKATDISATSDVVGIAATDKANNPPATGEATNVYRTGEATVLSATAATDDMATDVPAIIEAAENDFERPRCPANDPPRVEAMARPAQSAIVATCLGPWPVTGK